MVVTGTKDLKVEHSDYDMLKAHMVVMTNMSPGGVGVWRDHTYGCLEIHKTAGGQSKTKARWLLSDWRTPNGQSLLLAGSLDSAAV